MAYRIEYSYSAQAQLRALRGNDRARVADVTERHLSQDAEVEPPNGSRKRMRPNSIAAWRLRVDRWRVYYDVEGDTVKVRQIAYKRGTRVVTPAGEEVQTDG